MASQAPVVTQSDIDAYIASYQKAQADKIAQLKAAEATGMSNQYTQLYGGADIIPGTTQGILSNLGIQNPYLPVYSLIGSESVGGDNAAERMQFAPIPGVSYRLVNKATGETTTATTPEEIKALIAQSNALSAAGGKKADLAIESNQTGSWSPVFTDEPNPLFNDITKIALAGMIAATGAGLLQPGGLGGLGAAGTSGAGIGTTGSLAGAGLSSLPANLAAIQAGANAALAGAGLGTAAATGLGALAAGGIEALPGITVTAAGGGSILPAVGALAATGGAAAATGGAGTGGASGATNANQNLTKDQFGNVVDETGAIVSTGGGGSTSLLPAVGAVTGAAGAAAAAGGGGAGATDATITQNTQNAVDTAYQNAQTGAAGDTAAAGYNGMGAGPFVAPGAGATVGGGVFGTGLSIGEFATLTGLGIEAVKALVGGSGSGGDGTGMPYVSALGAMPSFTPRTQINPNITDYERYGYGPEALFFSGGQRLDTYTPPAATTPTQTTTPAAAPAATTPAATTTNLLDSAAGGGSGGGTDVGTNGSVRLTLTEGASGGSPVILEGGNKGPSTPENTGMTQERLDQLQDRFENMRSGDFFNYFKSVNDVLGNYAAKGIITPDVAQQYQSRLEAAASTPDATLASLQAAVPMPQISDFLQPTGTQRPVAPQPAPMQPFTYTAPEQPITDPNRYINDLYKQLGAQVSQGLLNVDQARNIQGQLRQNLLSQTPDIQQMQNIYNTAIQQYRPLI